MDTDICSRLGKEINDNVVAFYRKNLSTIQSSCYKPPTYCGFEFKNATLWVLPMPRNGDVQCTHANISLAQREFLHESKGGAARIYHKKKWKELIVIHFGEENGLHLWTSKQPPCIIEKGKLDIFLFNSC